MKKILSTALTCALLAGCGGGGSSVAPSVPSTGGSKTTQATLHFKFNNTKSIGGSARGRQYVSRNTLGMGISFRPTGTSAVTFGTTETALQSPMWTTNINPGYNANLTTCTAADPTGAFTCTVVIAVPAGYDDFQITTWDAAPQTVGTNGTFASTANDLSTAIVSNQYVQVNANNTFNYALSGVVNSVVLSPSVTQLVSGAKLGATDAGGVLINPANVTLSVLAKDFDGNIIIGNDQYVDVNGTPVTINVSEGEVDGSTGTPASGSNVTFGAASGTSNSGTANTCASSTSCTFNSPGSVSVLYNGLDTQSASFSASVSGGLSIQVVNSQIAFTQTNNGLGVPGPLTISEFADPSPGGVIGSSALGPDGRVWFAHGSASLSAVSAGGTSISTYSTAASGSTNPLFTAAGADGKVWFTDAQIGLGRINVDGSGAVAETAGLANFTPGSASWLGLAPNNRLWVTEAGSPGHLDLVNMDGTSAGSFTICTDPGQVVYGPNGHYYIACYFGLQELDPSNGSTVNTYTAVTGSSVVLGSDGNIYGTDAKWGSTTANLYKIQPGNASPIATYPLTIPPGLTVNSAQLAAGSDGNIWVTFGGGTNQYNAFVRVTPAGAPTVYTSGVSSSTAFLVGPTFGSDGNLYFGETNSDLFGEVAL